MIRASTPLIVVTAKPTPDGDARIDVELVCAWPDCGWTQRPWRGYELAVPLSMVNAEARIHARTHNRVWRAGHYVGRRLAPIFGHTMRWLGFGRPRRGSGNL
jgi:hypothetical protein